MILPATPTNDTHHDDLRARLAALELAVELLDEDRRWLAGLVVELVLERTA